MITELSQIQLLGYYLGLLGFFGIGLEFVALKVPEFLNEIKEKGLSASLVDMLISFFNSWQFGFILIFIATQFITGVLGDIIFFLGLGIAIPDIPPRFRRYWKYIVLVVSLSGILPSWLVKFLESLGSSEKPKSEESRESTETEEEGEEEIKWEEPKYVE